MAIETTAVGVPQLRIGVRFAIAAALLLAAIAVFIAITLDPPARVGVAEAGQASVVDYALRHPTSAPNLGYSNSPDYALRHLEG